MHTVRKLVGKLNFRVCILCDIHIFLVQRIPHFRIHFCNGPHKSVVHLIRSLRYMSKYLERRKCHACSLYSIELEFGLAQNLPEWMEFGRKHPTFRKLVHSVDFAKCILAGSHKHQERRNPHCHNPFGIPVYKFVVKLIHSHGHRSKHLELRIFHGHMVDCKRVHRLFQLDPMYIRACKHIDFHGNRRYHNLSIIFVFLDFLSFYLFRWSHHS